VDDTELKNRIWFDTTKCFINGAWISAADAEQLTLYNPSTGLPLTPIARGGEDDIDRAVQAANAAMAGPWGKSTALSRSRLLRDLSLKVSSYVDKLAQIEALDVGKPLTQARADAIALARYLEFYAGAADKLHGQTVPFMEGYTVYTLREPHGVTGHIIPWNYPMQIIGRSVGAALAAGNAVVLKPAEQACLTALSFADLASEVGFPPGVINVVPGLGEEAGNALSLHPQVQHISFTGSVATGTQVQTAAAQNVIPVTLELGGKSPQLVFDDADIDAALPFLLNSGIQNAGQTCSAASRILVQRSMFERVVEQLSKCYQSLVAGPAIRDLDASAPSAGYYFAPKLYANVSPTHVLAQEEIFGPVQVIIPFEEEEEGVEIANGTEYGLVASVWSRDGARQMRLAKALDAGQVFINNYGAGGGVELPFGGVGKSGHGREKGFEALYGFTRLKTVAAHHG